MEPSVILKPEFQYHIVLLEPEIPQNTGNVGRLCVATQSILHVVGSIPFSMDDKSVRRAGLDYWKHVQWMRHETEGDFFDWVKNNLAGVPQFWIENHAKQFLFNHPIPSEALFFFGKETTGISRKLLEQNWDQTYALPMFSEKIRSLNLANVVSIVLYEAVRQQLCGKSF